MTEQVAKWDDALVWCDECDQEYTEGIVTDDQRMRCPHGHDSIGPASR